MQNDQKAERQKDQKTKGMTIERKGKRTKGQKIAKRQKDKKTKRQDKKTTGQKNKRTKRPKREYNIVMSGQFRTLVMFCPCICTCTHMYLLAGGSQYIE